MPKLSDRERLAKIEADQRNLALEVETVRHLGALPTAPSRPSSLSKA